MNIDLKSEYWHWWAAALASAVYISSTLYYTQGHLSLPLDDPFIYFQYARQAASGHFLQYNTGDPATTGATSLLYMLLLVPPFWLGVDGVAIVVYALFWGGIVLGLCGRELRILGRLLGSPFAGELACALFFLCGPLLWGFLSGMEIGLFSFAILFALRQVIEKGGSRLVAAAILLALARPEGVLLYGLLILWLLSSKGRRGVRDHWFWILPLGLVLGQALLYKFLTGSWGSTGLAAKWRFSAPHFSWAELIRYILFDYAEYIKGILGGSMGHQTSTQLLAYDGNYRRMVFAPFFLTFFVAEVGGRIAAEWKLKEGGHALLASLWFALGILATCTLVEYDAHFNRYQQPFIPLFLLFAALAVARLRTLAGEWGKHVAEGVAGFFVLWGGISALFFAVTYGTNAADIHHMQIEMGHFIRENTPAHARVAINDAGAIRYFGQRQTVDLIGLTSVGFSESWRHGSGSTYERLESMADGMRPDYFAIFPNWFNFPPHVFLQPLHSIRLLKPSIVDAEKILYRAQWDGTVDAAKIWEPSLELDRRDWAVVDRLDVADVQNEAVHAYRSTVRIRGDEEANLLLALPLRAGRDVLLLDGGRTVTGGESFVMSLHLDRRAHLIMRTVSGIGQHFEVFCNGESMGKIQWPGGPGRSWREVEIATIEPEVHRGRAHIELKPLHDGGALRPIVSFHYWLMQ
jgi:hypothetical protein